jgi:hypothetical protein
MRFSPGPGTGFGLDWSGPGLADGSLIKVKCESPALARAFLIHYNQYIGSGKTPRHVSEEFIPFD